MEAKLVVVGGKAQAEEFALKLPAIVGRSRSADVPLNHPLVSRQHCELFEAGGRLMVRDLGSLNGTFVGDSRVAAEVEVLLTPGGHLTVGSVTFEAVYEAAPGENDEAPDFSLSDETVDVDQTVENSGVQPTASPAEEASHEESSGEGFDMSWLNDGVEEAAEPATAAAAAESPADLDPPTDDAEQTIQHVAPEPRRGAKAKQEAKRGAAKPKPEAPAKQEAKPKPAAAAAAPAEDVPTEFAPAEGGAHEGGGDDDMDDFFRSLTAS